MKKSKILLLSGIGVVLQFLLGSGFVLGQVVGGTKTIEITVDDPRPMAAASGKIEGLSGIPINYEDVPVYYAGDLQDVTDQARTPPPPGFRLMAPLMRHLSVPIVVDAVTGRLNDISAVQTALTALVSAYNSSDLPGAFEVEQSHGVFFVRPVRYRDASGAVQQMTPVLSTPITLPEEKRDAYLTGRLILQQVSKAAGSDVNSVVNLGMTREITFGADKEPADHVIARYIAARVCPGSRTDLCDPAIAQNSWDVGFSYSMGFDANPLTSRVLGPYWLGVHPVANSRWRVMPPSKPYSPPPRQPGDKPGTRRVP